MTRLLLFLLLAAALTAWSFWVYLRAELPVRGRRALAALRAGALLLVLALLFDPRLPWGDAGADSARWVLLDASLSMAAAPAGVESPWQAARERARALEAEGWRVVPFGDGLTALPTADSAATPDAPTTRLAEALRRAAEAGAAEVRVLSDLRFHDAVETGSVLAQGPGPVSFEGFGAEVSNAGVTGLDIPDVLGRDRPRDATIELLGDGSGDSVRVEIREEGRVVATWTGTTPPAGRLRRVSVALPPPGPEGRVRYTATATLPGDAFPEDDEAVAWAAAGFEEDALVLVSLTPDWEPRWLLPTLEQVTGLPGAGWLRAGPDRFVPMGRGVDRGAPVDSATVGRAAREAAVLVVHGLDADADAWARSLPGLAPRVLAWPHDVAGAAAVGVEVSPVQGGEWYASSDLPPSPVVTELAGQDFSGFPPLGEFFLVSDQDGTRPPLQVQLGGTGRAEAAVLLRREAGRRMVVPLTRGYWRWAARGGAPREGYRRLWGALAGWLLAADGTVAGAEVRPAERVVPRGEAPRWLLPADAGPVRLEVRAADSVVVEETLTGTGAVAGSRLEPGAYAYRASGPDGAVLGEGRFDVARTTDELLPAPRRPEAATGGEGAGPDAVRAGTPLRTSPWPYLLVLVLLCAEWIGRRRVGLR